VRECIAQTASNLLSVEVALLNYAMNALNYGNVIVAARKFVMNALIGADVCTHA
jgi:hypothetical protein